MSNDERSTPYESLPLERLKTEAERWIPYIADERKPFGEVAAGNASRGLRDIVQQAYDLGRTQSERVCIEPSPFDLPLDIDLAEAEEMLRRWKRWGEYACRRYQEETGKDLQAEAGNG